MRSTARSQRASLLPGAALAAVSIAAPAAGQEARVTIERDAATVRITRAGHAVATYRHGQVPYKPYLAELCTPGGLQVLRDAPPDHLHHHGCMLALGVNGVDFWGEIYVKKRGWERGGLPQITLAGAGDAADVRLRQALRWNDDQERTLLEEQRELRLLPCAGATLLTWRSHLKNPARDAAAHLWGRHYFGLGLRFLAALDGQGRFLTPDGSSGELVRGDERLFRARWCAYAARLGERAVTIALFEHPANPRRPTTWFTMARPFAYLGATLDLAREPLDLPAGQALELCYGLALWDGLIEPAAIEALCRTWIEGESPEPRGDQHR